MKKKSNNYILVFIGVISIVIGLFLMKTIYEPNGIMITLPYVLLGVGCGVFGLGMGNILQTKALEKNPEIEKEISIMTKDERNIKISNLAKAKTFNMMIYLFSALILIFTLMRVESKVILILVGVYLFMIFYCFYYRNKYEKEM